jgi:excisionase family DNA binding protein
MKQEQLPVSDLLPQIYHHINVVVRSAFKEAFDHTSKNTSSKESNIEEDYLSAEQAASFLKIKINTLYKKKDNGDLPYTRSGKRKLLFSKKDLESYVSKRKVKSNDEINDEVETYLKNKWTKK